MSEEPDRGIGLIVLIVAILVLFLASSQVFDSRKDPPRLETPVSP